MTNMNNDELKKCLNDNLNEEVKKFLKENLKIKLNTIGSRITVSLILGDEIISSDDDFIYTSISY